MEKQQEDRWESFVKVTLLVSVILLFIVGGAMISAKVDRLNIELYEEREQPIILVYFDSWGENSEDSNQAIFSYLVYNFGNTEAKNVTVVCQFLDEDFDVLKEKSYNIGNIASNSDQYEESYMSMYQYDGTLYGVCKLESADGKYINLYERLDENE